MTMLKSALVALPAALCLQPAFAQNWDCGDPGNLPQQGMNFCAAQAFDRADRALNVAWKAVRKNTGSTTDKPDLLLRSQRAWIEYRDRQCEAEGSKFYGGSLQPFIIATCRTRLTQQRTQELLLFDEEN